MGEYVFDYQQQPGRERTRYFSPDPQNALVSVITPFYNAGKYFEQTFNSVMNQTFPWFEWIIVNDGSTNEEDVAILHKFAAMDSRITVVTQENGGQSCARNSGIRISNTDLIVPLDADDVIDATYLECLYWSLYHHSDAAWCYSDSVGFQDQEYIWKKPFHAERLKTDNFLVATAMIRKSAIQEVGGYKVEKFRYNEDWRFWLEMLALDKKPIHINTPLFWYRRMENGMLLTLNKDSERVNFDKKIIENAGKKVNTAIQAIEYPVQKSQYSFYVSRWQKWDRTVNPIHERKRVMWLIPWMQMGGADKFNLDAIAGLREKGFDSYILTTQPSENEWRQKFETYTDEIFALPDFLDPAHYLEFVSYFIQSREIDVIMLSNSYDGYYMMPWIRQHFPDVVIVDYVHMEEWYWLAGGFARTSGAIAGITEKTYVCNSRTQNVIREKFHRTDDSVGCLHIGVDHHYFSREAEKTGYLRDLLGLSPERKIILFPCRIHGQKRPFLMLDIAEGVRKMLPDVAIVVAGDGPQLNELKEQILRRGLERTVYCIGSTNQMRACYRDSDLTLICSLKEGLALTAYESLSMGVPVVSSDVGGQSDLIGSDVGALLPLRQREEDFDQRVYDPEEIQDYVTHISHILQDDTLYVQLSQNCRAKIEAGFSIEKMVDKLSEELTMLCEEEGRAIQRRAVSAALNMVDNLASDYNTIYQQWKIQQDSAEEIWKARCWFEKLWKEKSQEYEEVWQARCWFEQKYKDACDNASGGLLRRCYRKIRRLLAKIYHKVVTPV